MLAPALGIGLLVAGTLMIAGKLRDTPTVHEAAAEIREVVLRRSDLPGIDDGGRVGPWWVSAGSYDQVTGAFGDFQVRTGDRLIGAETAFLRLDPAADTFAFELRGVVFTRIPDPYQTVETRGSLLHEVETFTLGPAPYGSDIVAAEAPPTTPNRREPPAPGEAEATGDERRD